MLRGTKSDVARHRVIDSFKARLQILSTKRLIFFLKAAHGAVDIVRYFPSELGSLERVTK